MPTLVHEPGELTAAATSVKQLDDRINEFEQKVTRALRGAVRAGTRDLGEVLTAAGPPTHTQAMVALVPRQEEIERLVLPDGEPAEELHLTLLFLGEASALPAGFVPALTDQLERYANEGTAMEGNAFAVNHFNPNGDDPALVLGVGGQWLPGVHDAVEQMVMDVDTGEWVMPTQHAPWVPHVTLAYQPTLEQFQQAAERLGPLMFDRLRLAVGDQNYDYDMTETVQASAAFQAQPEGVSLDDLSAIEHHWRQQLVDVIAPDLGRYWEEGARDQLEEFLPELLISNPVSLDLQSAVAENYLAGVFNRLRGIGDDLWRQTRLSLATGMHLGEDIEQLSRRVREVLASTEVRAQRIARTEVVSATNAGSLAQARALGDAAPVAKVWLATDDSRTRDTHRAANGQTVPLFGKFRVGDTVLDHPGDPLAPPEELVNCRCTIIYAFRDEFPQGLPFSLQDAEQFHLSGQHDQQDHEKWSTTTEDADEAKVEAEEGG